jgi:hypothetical protein
MKKWTILAAILLFVLFVPIYIFIPGKLHIVRLGSAGCNPTGGFRALMQDSNWHKWVKTSGMRGDSFQFSTAYYHALGITVKGADGWEADSRLNILPAGKDSVVMEWRCELPSSLDPWERVRQYRRAVRLKEEMDRTLARLSVFLSNKENIYGMPVVNTLSQDSSLIAGNVVTPGYPSTQEIYRMIRVIRTYISGQGAKETSPPMLHISRRGDGRFESMVAIPIDRRLNGNDSLTPKRFVPWKIVMGEVRGGASTAEEAMRKLRLYIEDYEHTSMAIPFQSLVTERDQEPDTTRWITRVIQPVS